MTNPLVTYIASISITFTISVGIFQFSGEIGEKMKASFAVKFGKTFGISDKKEVCLKGCDSDEQEKLKDVIATKAAIDNFSVEHGLDKLGNTKTTMAVKVPIYKKGLLNVDVGWKATIQENKVKDSNTAYLLNALADRSKNKEVENFLKRPYKPKTSENKIFPLILAPKSTLAATSRNSSNNKINNSIKLPVGSRYLINKDFKKFNPDMFGR